MRTRSSPDATTGDTTGKKWPYLVAAGPEGRVVIDHMLARGEVSCEGGIGTRDESVNPNHFARPPYGVWRFSDGTVIKIDGLFAHRT